MDTSVMGPLNAIQDSVGALPAVMSALLSIHETLILSTAKHADPKSLARYRAQIFSQSGEDGVIAEMLRRIGDVPHFFVEIGAGDGQENNTRFLLESGWRGIWWEASESRSKSIRQLYAKELASGQLALIAGMVTRENAMHLLLENGCPRDIGVLSIDIDMNTSHIWRALRELRCAVSVVEYNPCFTPPLDFEVEYNPRAIWRGDNLFGASLQRLETIGKDIGWVLVGCELTGINAYFVRENCVAGRFQEPFTAEFHYEPPRFSFLAASRGHPPAQRSAIKAAA